MQAALESPALQEPAGKLIDNNHFAAFYYIILVAVEKSLCLQAFFEVVNELEIFRRVKVFDAKNFFYFFYAGIRDACRPFFFISFIIDIGGEICRNAGEGFVKITRFFIWRGNDERGARFID